MITIIFRDYLYWFNSQIDYPIVLLIDNFSAHKLGLIFIKKGGNLYYIRIIFLPSNATSVYQLLD